MAGTGGIVSTVIAEQNLYAAQFSSIRGQLPGSLPWVERLRQKGMDEFITLGFPTTKLENWKYTNVAPIRRLTFEPAARSRLSSLPVNLHAEVESYPDPRLVFVNGWLDPSLSTLAGGPNATVSNVGEALKDPRRAALLERYLGRYASTSDQAFAAWNTSLFTDGGFIEIPRG